MPDDIGPLRKADAKLQIRFMAAKGSEPLDAVLMLKLPTPPQEGEPRPGDFTTRDQYRHALVERRRAFVQETLRTTLDALRELGLEVTGGDGVTRAVRVRGRMEHLLPALALEGVEHALSNG